MGSLWGSDEEYVDTIRGKIVSVPTIEPVNSGEWIEKYDHHSQDYYEDKAYYVCSCCEKGWLRDKGNSCPNCGAGMERSRVEMTFSIFYIVLWLLGLVVIATNGSPISDDAMQSFNELFTITNLLIAFGVFGICNRLDDIHKQLKEKVK